ncbi:hypothetical protein L1887_41776 [Cichorium endivia]|nr:hypothetical protein L1887_41776 [Cichorium endivia]
MQSMPHKPSNTVAALPRFQTQIKKSATPQIKGFYFLFSSANKSTPKIVVAQISPPFFAPNSRLSSAQLTSLLFFYSLLHSFFLSFLPYPLSSFFFGLRSSILQIWVLTESTYCSSRHGRYPMNPVHADQIRDRNFNSCLHPWRVSSKVLASSGSFCSVTLSGFVDYNG